MRADLPLHRTLQENPMSKKVLIVNASPRKNGNCSAICAEFAKGAEEAGNSVETVFLHEKNIGFCTGCFQCQGNGGTCILKDDMAGILDSLVAADVVVLATPVHFNCLTGEMKTYIDRTFPKVKEIQGKKVYLVVACATPDPARHERTLLALRSYTELLHAQEAGVLGAIGVGGPGEVAGKPVLEEAREMGRNC